MVATATAGMEPERNSGHGARDNHEARTDLYEKTKQSATERATYLQGTSLHGRGDTRAVLWTTPNEGQSKGTRYEGSRVSPHKTGLLLHGSGSGKAVHFKNEDVAEVHYISQQNINRPKGAR